MINNRTKEFRTKRLNQKGMLYSNDISIAFSILWDTITNCHIDNSNEAVKIEEHLELASYYARKALSKKLDLQYKPHLEKTYA